MIYFEDNNFEKEVLKSDSPVLVDFYAEWCPPCKMLSPIIEELADEYNGKIKVGKLNIDESVNWARKYDVMSVPTLILFKDGQEILRLPALRSKEDIKSEIEFKLKHDARGK
ncbi:MAG: thioredoxin [Patescibacteria group bacterium]